MGELSGRWGPSPVPRPPLPRHPAARAGITVVELPARCGTPGTGSAGTGSVGLDSEPPAAFGSGALGRVRRCEAQRVRDGPRLLAGGSPQNHLVPPSPTLACPTPPRSRPPAGIWCCSPRSPGARAGAASRRRPPPCDPYAVVAAERRRAPRRAAPGGGGPPSERTARASAAAPVACSGPGPTPLYAADFLADAWNTTPPPPAADRLTATAAGGHGGATRTSPGPGSGAHRPTTSYTDREPQPLRDGSVRFVAALVIDVLIDIERCLGCRDPGKQVGS